MDLNWNMRVWNKEYDWHNAGEEWSKPWGNSFNQWNYSILPRIHKILKGKNLLEIGSGYGRWTQYLFPYFEQVHLADISSKCLDAVKSRFSDSSKIHLHCVNGKSLQGIEDNSIDFIFSFDSLVHSNLEVIESYLSEFSRVLTLDGIGFIHHSNLQEYTHSKILTKLSKIIRALLPSKFKIWLRSKGFEDIYKSRSDTVSAKIFREAAERLGINVISQELINWEGTSLMIDCLSVISKENPVSPQKSTKIFSNASFMKEAKIIKSINSFYSNEDHV